MFSYVFLDFVVFCFLVFLCFVVARAHGVVAFFCLVANQLHGGRGSWWSPRLGFYTRPTDRSRLGDTSRRNWSDGLRLRSRDPFSSSKRMLVASSAGPITFAPPGASSPGRGQQIGRTTSERTTPITTTTRNFGSLPSASGGSRKLFAAGVCSSGWTTRRRSTTSMYDTGTPRPWRP